MHELTNNGKFAYANFDDEVLASASDYNEIVTEAGLQHCNNRKQF